MAKPTTARLTDDDAPESAADYVRISKALRADPERGELYWRESRRCVRAGDRAGCKANAAGYWCVKIDQRIYPLHRVMWLLVHGTWPPHEIDHINRNPSDNRIANLRLATRADNACNRGRAKNNTSGVTGVTWDGQRNKWLARAWHGRRRMVGGYFDSFDEAVAARRAAVAVMHGQFASTG
jgi:hypothetical protein